MEQHVCDHLRPVEDHLAALNCAILSKGQPWTSNCRFWITYQVLLDCDALKKRFNLPDFVEIHSNDDQRSGREKGLVCSVDHDGLIGRHPEDAKGATLVA